MGYKLPSPGELGKVPWDEAQVERIVDDIGCMSTCWQKCPISANVTLAGLDGFEDLLQRIQD